MKRRLLGITAFLMAAALVGCSAEKTKESSEKSSKSKAKSSVSEVEETTKKSSKKSNNEEEEATTKKSKKNKEEEETTTKKSSKNKEEEENSVKTYDEVTLSDITGSYDSCGYIFHGDAPEGFEPNVVDELIEDDPMVISEDGTLTFLGKEYKLSYEGTDEENAIFSIDGADFDMDEYKESGRYCDKEYEGPCALVFSTRYMYVNDVKCPYYELQFVISSIEDETGIGYFSFNPYKVTF